MIPYGRQDISADDIQAVVEVLKSDWLTQGPAVPSFEADVARRCGARHGVAASSATAALHLACRALGLGPGDTLWTSANTFAASANCALYCGAGVDFVDIDPRTWNMSVDALADKLAAADRAGKLPRVVIPVHFAGLSCDMEAIAGLARRYGFKVIEDASHAIGATSYGGQPVGDCRYSDIAVFSFHPVKIVTTGEGGMALCNDPAIAERLRLLRTHGITRDPEAMEETPHGPWYYEQIDLGYNYRMTDIQAALGSSQLARLDDMIARRRELARWYGEQLAGLPVVAPLPEGIASSACHLYPVRVSGQAGGGRGAVFDFLRGQGIGVNVHYLPVYLHPYYRRLGFAAGHCPEAEKYYAEAISLPMFPTLGRADREKVVRSLKEAFDA